MNNIYEVLKSVTEEMAKEAAGLGYDGVAVAGWLERGDENDWKVAMKAAGKLKTVLPDGRAFNSACVAFAKLGEMMETKRNSGDAGRPLLGCETGFMGGAIQARGGGYIAAAFSGGPSEDDLAIAERAVARFIERAGA